MKAPTKQTYMKALLLLALAGNISWHPSTLKLHSYESASELRGGGAIRTSSAPRTDLAVNKGDAQGLDQAARPVETRKTDVAKVEIKKDDPSDTAAATDDDDQEGSDKPAQLTTTVSGDRVEFPTVCKVSYRVTFKEEKSGDQLQTRAIIERRFVADKKPLGFIEAGSLATVLDNEDSRAQIDAAVENMIRGQLGDSCAKNTVAADKPASRRTTERQQERIARGMENCTLDEEGHATPSDEMSECQMDRLADFSFEDDGAASRMRAMRQLEVLVKGLKATIKKNLIGDEESAADAETMIQEVVSNLNRIGIVKGLDRNRINALKQSVAALKSGGQTFRAASLYNDDAMELANELNIAREEAIANPNNMAAQMRVAALLTQTRSMAAQISGTVIRDPYSTMLNHQRNGWLSQQDVNDFSAPLMSLDSTFQTINPQGGFNLGNLQAISGNVQQIGAPNMSQADMLYRQGIPGAGVQPFPVTANIPGLIGTTNLPPAGNGLMNANLQQPQTFNGFQVPAPVFTGPQGPPPGFTNNATFGFNQNQATSPLFIRN